MNRAVNSSTCESRVRHIGLFSSTAILFYPPRIVNILVNYRVCTKIFFKPLRSLLNLPKSHFCLPQAEQPDAHFHTCVTGASRWSLTTLKDYDELG
jgi:hypothetical protein